MLQELAGAGIRRQCFVRYTNAHDHIVGGAVGYRIVTGGLFTDAVVGRDILAGIATRYGLDGPGIESRWGRDFPHPSGPALGPTHTPVQWVPGLSRG